MHPVRGATAKLHTQNRTFRKFATHAPTGAAALVSAPTSSNPSTFPSLSFPYPTLPLPSLSTIPASPFPLPFPPTVFLFLSFSSHPFPVSSLSPPLFPLFSSYLSTPLFSLPPHLPSSFPISHSITFFPYPLPSFPSYPFPDQ